MSAYRCEACGIDLPDGADPADHETRRHDGAQTCWPTETKKEAS